MSPPVPHDDSLARVVGLLETTNPNLYRLFLADTEESFIEVTEDALEQAIRTIEGGAKRYSALDERGLSRLVTDLLNQAGHKAMPERDHNGHVDIVIEHAFGGGWKYLGECKIYRHFQYHVDGCQQLLGYCSGRELRAFNLEFFKSPEMFEKLAALRQRFDQEKPALQKGDSRDHRILGAFLTEHKHSNGRHIELLHLGCAVRVPN